MTHSSRQDAQRERGFGRRFFKVTEPAHRKVKIREFPSLSGVLQCLCNVVPPLRST
ncbi:hypothetical protein BCAR13_360045 [Paraburkholderia caribensis]|nr:hypothetical protein BCAR13_360045 [Paraburkholderia caribensis]